MCSDLFMIYIFKREKWVYDMIYIFILGWVIENSTSQKVVLVCSFIYLIFLLFFLKEFTDSGA